MSIHRSTFLTMSGAALVAGLLALSGCGSTADGNSPSTPAQSTTELPSTAPGPTNSAPVSTAASSSAPAGTTGESVPAQTDDPASTIPPIPSNALDYADALVVAWGIGDRERMAQLAEPGALDVLDHYGPVGGPHWDQAGHDAGAGSVFVSYENSTDGTTLELRVRNEAASKAQEHAVVEAKLDG